MKNKKGFTLIELLTVIAILAIILLIAAPVILGVLDKARKNTFKNQVLLYVEGLKQQTALAAMGQGYSELQKIDTAFYSPTSDSTGKIVRVSISSLNKIMDNAILSSDEDKYMYVEWSDNGYNYYIGEGVRKEGEYSTTCAYATGKEACEDKVYNNENIKLINSKVLALVHISRNDLVESNSSTNIQTLSAPTIQVTNTSATLEIPDGITHYCITQTDNNGTCTFQSVDGQDLIDITQDIDGTYYVFVATIEGTNKIVSQSTEYIVSKPLVSGNNGDSISLGGYNWHIIGQDDTKIWLLMDAFDGVGVFDANRQLEKKEHCTQDVDDSTDCAAIVYAERFNYHQYSWDKSKVRDYLNKNSEGGFLYTLPANVKNRLVSTNICIDGSLISDSQYSYGGYTESEIEELKKTYPNISCSEYVSDLVRLITPAEYYNLTDFYTNTTYPANLSDGNQLGKIPKVNYIDRLNSNDWLYGYRIDGWWTTGAFSNSGAYFYAGISRFVNQSGSLISTYSQNYLAVRPVIVIKK